ncbi:glycosyltransferase 87 family protein [Catenulispora pinisilvae]|uniref:glycosyltransferase 87 family protein n=1 Tax=Catenulispora pinisilvae TaxID=2705253 RepID=UPI0018927C96|nr:glycosyltransferase 87 family protein [Catenulispora pinisilvae]
MPQLPATVRSLPVTGAAALTALRRGERVPYLGIASQHARIARGRTLAVVGLVAFVCSVWLRIVVVSAHPQELWLNIDLDVYYEAGRSLAHDQQHLYSNGFGLGKLPYLYPPLTALGYAHLTWLTFDQIKVLTAAVSIACLVTVAWSAWGLLGYRAGFGRLGAALGVAAVGIWLEPVHSNLNLGQVNVVVMALVVADLAQADRRWTKGIGIGLATAIKLTPGLFVVYLLLTRRFRAAAVATGSFVAVSGAVWLVLPKGSREFWFHAIGVTSFGRDYAANQSFQGMFLRLLNNNDHAAKYPWLLASALIVIIGLAAAALAANRGAELLAGAVVSVIALEISPISWTCHWVWVELLLVLAIHAAIRSGQLRTRVWVTVGTIAMLAWPMRVNDSGGSDPRQPLIPTGLINYAPRSLGREEAWDPFQMLYGNGYVLAGVAFVIAVAVLEFRRLRRDETDAVDRSETTKEPEELAGAATSG